MAIDIVMTATIVQGLASGLDISKNLKGMVDNWNRVSEHEKTIIDNYIYFLGDRRVLCMLPEYEVLIEVRQSVHEIRECTMRTHELLNRKDHTETRKILDVIRRACVNYIKILDKVDNIEDVRFIKGLLDFRAIILFWVDLVAMKLELEVPEEIKLKNE